MHNFVTAVRALETPMACLENEINQRMGRAGEDGRVDSAPDPFGPSTGGETDTLRVFRRVLSHVLPSGACPSIVTRYTPAAAVGEFLSTPRDRDFMPSTAGGSNGAEVL